MSEPAHVPEAEKFDAAKLGGLPNNLLIAGVVGLALTALGAFVIGKEQFAYTYLFAFAFFFTVILGAAFWNCLHHATDSEWSVVIRRQIENVASLFPYLFILFLPLLGCAGILWKWWNIPPGVDSLLDAKQPYLSQWFFLLRVALYFGVVSLVVMALRGNSTKQDADGQSARSFAMRKLGIGGIPAVALTITFAGFDWLMGLDYHWFSTMWGVYLFAGAAGSSMSLIVIIVTALKDRGYLKVVNDEHYHIMGKFMLAFTIFWAYIGFSQYMLIWYANIPEETVYYIIRNQGNWVILSTLLVVGRFFLPFPILLTQWVKKHPHRLRYVAIWIIVMQVLDIFVIVIPTFRKTGFGFVDVAYSICPLVGIGGILGWLFFKRRLTQGYLFPTKDPRLGASIKLHN
ncbi:MAG: hypothetical protein ABMA13_11675 [Chthoniobacteraceae bacterium]